MCTLSDKYLGSRTHTHTPFVCVQDYRRICVQQAKLKHLKLCALLRENTKKR